MGFKNILVLSIVCGVLINVVSGKVFERCELAKELYRQGFPMNQLPDWVCLVEAESSRRTNVIGPQNTDGSYDWGLFQINDMYWCKDGSRGGQCNIDCNSLLTNDIEVASRCAQHIYQVHGFCAWVGWNERCQGTLPDISHCFYKSE